MAQYQSRYATLATDDHTVRSTQEKPARRKREGTHDWKPVPLRWPFLTCLIIVFAACITSIEVVLRHTVPTLSSSSNSSQDAISTTSLLRPRPREHSKSLYRREFETTNCDNTATLPARAAASKSASSSLCQQFTASYKAHTANMSFPIQTEVAQWLVQYEAASQGWRSAINSEAYCSSEAASTTAERQPYHCDGNYPKTIDVLCTETVVDLSCDVCTGFGSAWITGFALTSTVNPVCGAWTSQVIDTATVGDVTTLKTTPVKTSNVETTNAIDAATASYATVKSTTVTPSGIASTKAIDPTSAGDAATLKTPTAKTTKVGENTQAIATTTPSAKAPTSTTSLPTITKSGSILIPTSSNQATKSPSPAVATSVGTTDVFVATRLQESTEKLDSTSAGKNSVAIVAPTGSSASVTLVQIDAQGATKTTVVPATSLTASRAVGGTNAGSQVGTVTNSDGAVTTAAIITFTNSNGELITTTAASMVTPAATFNVLTTNSQGQIETLMLAADQLVPITSTVVTEDGQGSPLTLTTVFYGVSGGYATYTTTNADGLTQTLLSKMSSTSQTRYTTTTQYTSLLTTTNADGSVSSFSAVVVETTVLTTPPAARISTTSTAGSQPQATGDLIPMLAKDQRMVNIKYSSSVYGLAMYAPPVYAVLVKALWEMVFAAVKLVQPFQRMSNRDGCSPKDTLFAEFLSSSFSLEAFTSLGHGNVLPFLSGLLYIMAQIGPPLYSTSSTIKARSICSYADGHQQRCDPVWVVHTTLLRISEAIAAFCIFTVLLMAWFLRKSRTGLDSDPSSLAALATLSNHEPLLLDLQKTSPPLLDQTVYQDKFVQYRVRLGYHTNDKYQQLYGVIGTKERDFDESLPELDHETVSSAYRTSQHRQNYQSIHSDESSFERTSFASRVRRHFVTDICGFVLALSLLALVLTFYLDNSHDAFNRFFNSGSWSSKFLLVALATLCSLHLSHLERLVRVAEPFRRLSVNGQALYRHEKDHRNSEQLLIKPYETSLLVDRSGTPYSTWARNILLLTKHEFRGGSMLFQTLLSLTVILADLNIIAASGIAYNEAMTVQSYRISSKITIALTSWILLIYLVVLLWWRRAPAIAHLTGRSVSKGAGTIGACMRWLVAGDQGLELLDAVLRVKRDHEHRNRWHMSRAEAGNASSIRIWFSRVQDAKSTDLEVWSLSKSNVIASRSSGSGQYSGAGLLQTQHDPQHGYRSDHTSTANR